LLAIPPKRADVFVAIGQVAPNNVKSVGVAPVVIPFSEWRQWDWLCDAKVLLYAGCSFGKLPTGFAHE
jgi:hypothetical protein